MFDTLSDKFSQALKVIQGQHKISEANIEEALKDVRTALLEADVNFKVVKNFIQVVKEKALGEEVIKGVNPGQLFIKMVHDQLTELMGVDARELDFSRHTPLIILVVGLNGAGKTTFCGKLSLFLRQKYKKNPYLIPADNFRPAAKDQLITLARNLGVDFYDSDLSLHPRDIALKGIETAKQLGREVIIIDTAGRLHVDEELMQQISEVKAALASFNPEVLLVADAMTGQEAVNVSETFHRALNLTGVVLSKMDSDARGGAALSIRYVTQVPIMFFSQGEKMKDLEIFHPDRLAKRILDMGDILTLVEKAQENINEEEAMNLMDKMEKNAFTIDDFLRQMEMISKMGPLANVMKMIPGMGGALRQMGDLSPAQDEMKKVKVMISSMTLSERKNHKLMNPSRVRRIANGSGTKIGDVQAFITKFEQMRGMMSGMMKMFKGGGNPMDLMNGQLPGQMSQPTKKKKKGKGPWGNRYF